MTIRTIEYRVVTKEGCRYGDEAVLTQETDDFKIHVEKHLVVFEFKTEVSSLDEAKELIGPFIRSWVVHAGLEKGVGCFNHVYQRHSVQPEIEKSGDKVKVTVHDTAILSHSYTVAVTSQAYPEPKQSFIVSPLVDDLYQRYARVAMDQETLPSMAYYLTTAIAKAGGTEKDFCRSYSVSHGLITEIRKLSSRKGGPEDRRKADAEPISGEEQEWLRRAVVAVIRQIGEIEGGATPGELTKDKV